MNCQKMTDQFESAATPRHTPQILMRSQSKFAAVTKNVYWRSSQPESYAQITLYAYIAFVAVKCNVSRSGCVPSRVKAELEGKVHSV